MSLIFVCLGVQSDKALLRLSLIGFIILSSITITKAQHSIARKWNEVLLQAIREDFARPTVHSRNLFHISIAMYDSWAAYDNISSTYFLLFLTMFLF